MTEPSLVAEVEALLYRHDPVGIAFGDNPDEYRPEAETIVARLPGARSVDDVRTLVHREFVRWFDQDIVGPAERYEGIARELWAAWLARSAGESWSRAATEVASASRGSSGHEASSVSPPVRAPGPAARGTGRCR